MLEKSRWSAKLVSNSAVPYSFLIELKSNEFLELRSASIIHSVENNDLQHRTSNKKDSSKRQRISQEGNYNSHVFTLGVTVFDTYEMLSSSETKVLFRLAIGKAEHVNTKLKFQGELLVRFSLLINEFDAEEKNVIQAMPNITIQLNGFIHVFSYGFFEENDLVF